MQRLEKLKTALNHSDAVLVGAGAGLSSSAGFVYSGERFHENFPDFEEKYGFHDMYAGGFYPYPDSETFWAFWSRNILLNRYQPAPKPVYETLYELVKNKNYFVLTTNVDHCFQKAGFEKNRLFYTQGDYGLFQCSVPCHDKTYDNEAQIYRMIIEQRDMSIPSELVPRCPVCGKPMTTNLRCDDTFVQDEGWYAASERYQDFLARYGNGKILYLELGGGHNTPVIIKYPFWKYTSQNPNAVYASVNLGEAYAPPQIESRSILLDGDIGEVLSLLKE